VGLALFAAGMIAKFGDNLTQKYVQQANDQLEVSLSVALHFLLLFFYLELHLDLEVE